MKNYAGLIIVVVLILLVAGVNRWIKKEIDDSNTQPSAVVVPAAVPAPAAVTPQDAAVEMDTESPVAMSDDSPKSADVSQSEKSQEGSKEVVYETPLISPILMQ